MRDMYRLAGEEAQVPQLFIAPLIDRGIGTLKGRRAYELGVRQALYNYIEPELTDSEEIRFADISETQTPDMDVLLDRYEDITGGLHPGRPTIKSRDINTGEKLEDFMGLPAHEVTTASLARFYRLTKLRPHVARMSVESSLGEPTTDERSWGADMNKMFARIRLPNKAPLVKSLLHELGHCCMPWVGFTEGVETKVDADTLAYSVSSSWLQSTAGLTYVAEDGAVKGAILEEATAEGLGSLVNKRLHLAQTRYDEGADLPEVVAPYMVGVAHSSTAPSAVALELIAKELGIPSGKYFRMWADYANVGVRNSAARQEMAETVYRGTRGRLTLNQVEELPYPINKEASLALLWAVEDSLDVPDHQRYADLFFQNSTKK